MCGGGGVPFGRGGRMRSLRQNEYGCTDFHTKARAWDGDGINILKHHAVVMYRAVVQLSVIMCLARF